MINASSSAFNTQFEQKLTQLKQQFSLFNALDTTAGQRWQQQFSQMKAWLYEHRAQFKVRDASSLYAVPTTCLMPGERRLHRVWLGGLPPTETIQTCWQWQQAIVTSHSTFRQQLWVWNETQIESHPQYVPQESDDPCQLGALFIDECMMTVFSLSQLVAQSCPSVKPFLYQLNQSGFFATLSDYFRLVIISHYGGVYLDADTLPAQPATLFLAMPELPAFTSPEGHPIRWMNLFLDETGMIIAHRGEPTIQAMYRALTDIYLAWPHDMSVKSASLERAIFEPFYQLWCQQLNISQISHQDFSQRYALWGYADVCSRTYGIKGMRLQEDILSGKTHPLSSTELVHYQQSVTMLSQCNWQLDNPLQLEDAVTMLRQTEAPPLAFSPQLRAEIPYYHYYRVLSSDPNLDRVNDLFASYLIAVNQQKIEQGNFWYIVHQKEPAEVWFKPGVKTNTAEQLKMARWILDTSYLEYCSVDNLPGCDIVSLQHQLNIHPHLDALHAIYNVSGGLIGFVIAGPAQRQSASPVYCYRQDIRPLDEAYERFVAVHQRPDDYFTDSIALAPEARGRGYFSSVLAFIVRQAKSQQSSRITLCVWASNPATDLYRKKGFHEQARMVQEVACFTDSLLFMALPL